MTVDIWTPCPLFTCANCKWYRTCDVSFRQGIPSKCRVCRGCKSKKEGKCPSVNVKTS